VVEGKVNATLRRIAPLSQLQESQMGADGARGMAKTGLPQHCQIKQSFDQDDAGEVADRLEINRRARRIDGTAPRGGRPALAPARLGNPGAGFAVARASWRWNGAHVELLLLLEHLLDLPRRHVHVAAVQVTPAAFTRR
jgi:hypothetical protein